MDTNTVEAALNTVRPYLQQDGGDVELVKITDQGDVYLRFVGSCSTCNMSEMTMTAGIEHALRNAIPALGKIISVKD